MTRWTWCRPFQAIGTPWIPAYFFTAKDTVEEIRKENHLRCNHPDGTPGDEFIHRFQIMKHFILVGICQAARKADNTEDMHGEKGSVEKEKGEKEMQLAPTFVHHPSEHLWKPKIDGAKDTHRRSREQHIVKVSDDEIGVVDKNINRCCGHENPGKTANDKHRNKRQGKQHRGRKK